MSELESSVQLNAMVNVAPTGADATKHKLKSAPGVNKVTVHHAASASVNSFNPSYNYNPAASSFHLPATSTSSYDLELNAAATPFMTNSYHYMYQPFNGANNATGAGYYPTSGASGNEYYWPMNPAMMPAPAALFPSSGDYYHNKPRAKYPPGSKPMGNRTNGYRHNQRSGEEGKSRRDQQQQEKVAVAPQPVLDDKNFPAIGGDAQPLAVEEQQQQQQQQESVVQREDSPTSHSSSDGGNKKWADVVRKNNPGSIFDNDLPALPVSKTDQNNNELDAAQQHVDNKNATSSEESKNEAGAVGTGASSMTNGYKSYHNKSAHKNGHYKPNNHYATMFNYGEFYPSAQYSGIHHQHYMQPPPLASYLANDLANLRVVDPAPPGNNYITDMNSFVSYLNGDDLASTSNTNWKPQPYRNKYPNKHHHHHHQPHHMAGVPASWSNTINQTYQDIYNPVDFKFTGELEQANDASRFFIIKSYSREDVIRAIYHSVWCSTEIGNARLSEAYSQKPSSMPALDHTSIYLFFSVNGSGQFCGMAEMASPVDFGAKCPIWTQDKWKGKFDLKWIYVKDVPNGKFKHITLPNNENKPVTNSRDCQEIPIEQARQVLNVLRSYHHHSTILDDMSWLNEQTATNSNTTPSESGAETQRNKESSNGESSRYQTSGYRPRRNNDEWDNQSKAPRGHSYKQLKLQNYLTAATAATLATSKSNGNNKTPAATAASSTTNPSATETSSKG